MLLTCPGLLTMLAVPRNLERRPAESSMNTVAWIPLVSVVAAATAGCGGPASPPFKPVAETKILMQAVLDPSADEIWDSAGEVLTPDGVEDSQPEDRRGVDGRQEPCGHPDGGRQPAHDAAAGRRRRAMDDAGPGARRCWRAGVAGGGRQGRRTSAERRRRPVYDMRELSREVHARKPVGVKLGRV